MLRVELDGVVAHPADVGDPGVAAPLPTGAVVTASGAAGPTTSARRSRAAPARHGCPAECGAPDRKAWLHFCSKKIHNGFIQSQTKDPLNKWKPFLLDFIAMVIRLTLYVSIGLRKELSG